MHYKKLIQALAYCLLGAIQSAISSDQLPDTRPLDWNGDLASRMVDGVDRFLLDKLDESIAERSKFWSGGEDWSERVKSGRKELGHILGMRDRRSASTTVELIARPGHPTAIASNDRFDVSRIRWKAIGNIFGEGLLLEPKGEAIKNVIAIPDASQTAEDIASSGYVPHLAASGCRVVVPALVSRRVRDRRQSQLTDREYLYRSSFELGRQLTGYELQKILAVIDWFNPQQSDNNPDENPLPVGVIGWGEGGRLALYASALDDRIAVTCVSGYFGPRQNLWQEPIDRNVFGLLNHFGDAEVAGLSSAKHLVIDAAAGPIETVRTKGGAPYQLTAFDVAEVAKERDRIPRRDARSIRFVDDQHNEDAAEHTVTAAAIKEFALALEVSLAERIPGRLVLADDLERQDRLIAEIEQFNQALLAKSPYVRKDFFKELDVSSVEAHARTVESYREVFRNKVVGSFEDKLMPANPRSRKVLDNPKWTGYEVVLDVFQDVFAYGILLIPKDLSPNEKRPVVVCQHGLEGRPRNIIEKDHPAYHDFAAKLAERGFITFAPQNIYIFEDRFRTLQRKANPLGKTLFSIMVPQHQQIV